MQSPQNTNVTFNGVTAIGCKTRVISIHNYLQAEEIDQYVTVNDLMIRDLEYVNPTHVIFIDETFSTGVFKVVYNRLVIENVLYERVVNIATFYHKTDQFLEFNDSILRNISNCGFIGMYGSNQGTGINTRMQFNNLTIEDMFVSHL